MKKLTLLAAGMATLLTGPLSSAAEINLKISHMFPSTHFIQTLALEPWAKEIEEKTDGKVSFTFFAAGSALGDATRQYDQVRMGVVDIAIGIPAIPRGRHPRTVLAELPFVVPDSAVGTCALMAAQDELQPDFRGTHILSLTVTEPSAVHTKTEVKTLEDLKGMRIRTPTPAISAMLNYLGATPVGMPPTQIYESVERGVIEGNVMPWGPVGAFKLYEVLNYHLDAAINPVAMYVLMNERRYNSLPDDVKAVFDEMSGEWFTSRWGPWWSETDQQAIDAAKAQGNTVTPMSDEMRDQYREKLQGVIDNYLANDSDLDADEARRIYARLQEAVTGCQ